MRLAFSTNSRSRRPSSCAPEGVCGEGVEAQGAGHGCGVCGAGACCGVFFTPQHKQCAAEAPLPTF
eukprot:284238-Chlamydomonas_euryale.AAC.1